MAWPSHLILGGPAIVSRPWPLAMELPNIPVRPLSACALEAIASADLCEGVEPALKLTLVSIGEYPRSAHFGGLGELSAEQLARLLPDGVPLRADVLRHERRG